MEGETDGADRRRREDRDRGVMIICRPAERGWGSRPHLAREGAMRSDHDCGMAPISISVSQVYHPNAVGHGRVAPGGLVVEETMFVHDLTREVVVRRMAPYQAFDGLARAESAQVEVLF